MKYFIVNVSEVEVPLYPDQGKYVIIPENQLQWIDMDSGDHFFDIGIPQAPGKLGLRVKERFITVTSDYNNAIYLKNKST